MLMVILLSGCLGLGTSETTETERTMCRELRRDLPTYSPNDTIETLESGANFIDVFNAICPR